MHRRIVEGEPEVIPGPLTFLRRFRRIRTPAATPAEPWSRLAAYALCRDDDGRILLARVSSWLPADAGSWTMPGGRVEWGEHPDAAVVRELEEETGLLGTVDRVAAVWSDVITADVAVSGVAGHVLGIVYDVTIVGGSLRDEPAGTTDTAAWFTLNEARALPRVGLVGFCLDLC